MYYSPSLTHWGRVTHICVGKLTIIGSVNGLSPRRRQAIIWTNAGILLIEPLGTNFSEILIGIQMFSLKKMRLKMSSAKWRPFCLGLNELMCSCVANWWYWCKPILGFRRLVCLPVDTELNRMATVTSNHLYGAFVLHLLLVRYLATGK